MTEDKTEPPINHAAIYIFAYYWIFETFTTVGYGDYAGVNSREYIVTIVFEFIGFCYNAVLIGIMGSVFNFDMTFNDLLADRLDEMSLWIMRLEKSYKPYHMLPDLCQSI